MRILYLIFILKYSLCFGGNELVNYVLKNDNPMPPEIISFIFDDQAKTEFKKISFPDADKINLDIAKKVSAIKEAQYQKTLSFAKNVVAPTIVGVGAGLSAIVPPLGGSVVMWGFQVNTVAAMAAIQADNIISAFQSRQNEAIETVSMNVLNEYNKKYGDSLTKYFNNEMTVDDIVAKMNGGVSSPLLSKIYKNLTPNQQKRVSFQMAIHLKDLMAKGFHDLDVELSARGDDIDQAVSDIRNIEESFTAFRELQEKRISSIIENQKNITDKINSTLDLTLENRSDIARNTDEINFTNSLLYGHLTSKEKRDFLEHNKDSLSPEDFKKESDRLDLIIIKEKICQTTVEIANGANDLYQIADNFGLFRKNPKMQEKSVKVLKIVNALGGAINGYYTGNYLGAINSVSSLFKKDSPDIAGLRHEAIMGALNEMRQENYQYYRDIMEGQKLLSKQMEAHFNDLYKKLNELQNFIQNENSEIKRLLEAHDRHLDDLQKVVIKDYNQGFVECERALLTIQLSSSSKNKYFIEGKFKDYNSFFDFVRSKNTLGQSFKECFRFIDKNVTNFFTDSPYYLSQNYRSELAKDEDKIDFLRKTARLFLTLPKEERMRLYPMLTMPSQTLNDIDLKYKLEIGYEKERQPFNDENDNQKKGILAKYERSVLSDYISPDILFQTYHVVMGLAPYMEFFEGSNVKSAEEVAKSSYTMAFDGVIAGLIRRIDLAIIQQNLLNGDVAMEHFYNILHLTEDAYSDVNSKSKLNQMQKDLRELLDENRELGFNFLSFSTKKKFSREFLAGYRKDYSAAYNGVMSEKFKILGHGFYEDKMKPLIAQINNDSESVKTVSFSTNCRYGYFLPTVDALMSEKISENKISGYLLDLRTHLESVRYELHLYNMLNTEEKNIQLKSFLKHIGK